MVLEGVNYDSKCTLSYKHFNLSQFLVFYVKYLEMYVTT